MIDRRMIDLCSHPAVRLTKTCGEHRSGEVGTVVSCHAGGESMVEFADKNGVTLDMVMVPNEILEAVEKIDVLVWKPDAPPMVAYLRQIGR